MQNNIEGIVRIESSAMCSRGAAGAMRYSRRAQMRISMRTGKSFYVTNNLCFLVLNKFDFFEDGGCGRGRKESFGRIRKRVA